MLAAQALRAATEMLARHHPGAGPPQPLNAHAPDQESYVFRAALAPEGSIIAKVAAPGRLLAQFDRLQAVHPQMADGLYRVPAPLAHDAEAGVMLMEDAWGQAARSLWQNGATGRHRVLTAAGGWLGRYHRLSASTTGFNPDPHLNWLEKSLALHRDGARNIPEYEALCRHLPRLQHLAQLARDDSTRRCITHRDFHLGNLLIRKQGRSYGIDMENASRDEAMRDLLFFLADAAMTAPEPPDPAGLRTIGLALRGAYGHSPADPAARMFFQTSVALTMWAGLNQTADSLGPAQSRRLTLCHALLAAKDVLAGPDTESSRAI